MQLYVDDPAVTVVGDFDQREAALDVVILWWLVLGLPLAWNKGLVTDGLHTWIGATYQLKKRTDANAVERVQIRDSTAYVVIGVPEEFIEKLILDIDYFMKVETIDEITVEKLLGRAGRLSYLVPATKPFTSMLWAAKMAADNFNTGHRRRYPLQRFSRALRWIRTLLRPPAGREPWLPLHHIISNNDVHIDLNTAPAVEFDASPWGYGFVLKSAGKILEYGYGYWTTDDAEQLGIAIGKPDGQTTWEYLALFIVLATHGHVHRSTGLALLGDNLASLNLALNLKGSASLGRISREIAWRRVRAGWRYACGHLPSEQNQLADDLSRVHQPDRLAVLPPELREVSRHPGLKVAMLWTPDL